MNHNNPVIYYCAHGPLEMLKNYLPECPEKNCCDEEDHRYIPLHTAIFNGQNKIARYLIEEELSSVNFSVERNRTTPLHLAVYKKNNVMVSYLIHHPEININATDKWGKTPLIHAMFHGNIKAVTMLLKAGADIHVRDNYGFTAYYSSQIPEIREVFKKHAVEAGLMATSPTEPCHRESSTQDVEKSADDQEDQNSQDRNAVGNALTSL